MCLLRVVAIAVLMAVANVSASAAGRTAATYQMVANGEVQIGPDGRVSDYRLKSELAPSVAELVNRSVRLWRFEPIVQDGRPVIAKTALRIRLTAERATDNPDNFVVRVAAVDFGAPDRSAGGKPPRYPDRAVRARLNAKVMLVLRLDDTGKVIEAFPYQTSLGARTRSESDAESWRKIFERASIAAAKTWKYNLTEDIGGRRLGSYALAPIEFRILPRDAGGEEDEKWQGYVPGPVHELPADFGRENRTADRASRLADGETAALSTRFRLVDDVVGKIL